MSGMSKIKPNFSRKLDLQSNDGSSKKFGPPRKKPLAFENSKLSADYRHSWVPIKLTDLPYDHLFKRFGLSKTGPKSPKTPLRAKMVGYFGSK